MTARRRGPGLCLAVLLGGVGIYPGALRGQDWTDQPAVWRAFPRHLGQDQKGIWSSPFRPRRKDAKWWLLFGSTTATLLATDHWTSRQLPNTPHQVDVSLITSRFGAVYTLAPGVMALYAAGRLRHDERLRETGIVAAEALTNTFLVTNVLKTATWRERPIEGTGDGRFWKGAGRVWNDGGSFPSGHSSGIWAAAAVVAREYPRPRIIPIAAYGLAATVTVSRFTARRHFASDVVVGAGIGWFIGDYVFRKRHNRSLDTARERGR